MDYETSDGSQFSLQPIWSHPDDGPPKFEYTSISAYVDGVAYTGRVEQRPVEVDEVDVLGSLEPVPVECIHPPYQEGCTLAPPFDATQHYWKAPSFTYDDCRPGNTFVADCVLNEVAVLERLRNDPHPNLARYYGCVVEDGRITHICLERYHSNLVDRVCGSAATAKEENSGILDDLSRGVHHLHSLGLAHNDINPYNICIDTDGTAVLIDFDSCLPFGKELKKGIYSRANERRPISSKDNDLNAGMGLIRDFLEKDDSPVDSENEAT